MTEQGWVTIITAILAALPVTIAAIMANQKLKALHIDVNSRLTKMLELAGEGGELKERRRVEVKEDERKEEYLGDVVVPPPNGT